MPVDLGYIVIIFPIMFILISGYFIFLFIKNKRDR